MTYLVLISVFLSGALTVVFIKNTQLRKQSRIKSAFIYELRIEELLSSLIAKTSVDRALLCKSHNGGSAIVIGGQKMLTVTLEPDTSLYPHTRKEYTKFPMDPHYRQTMVRCMEATGPFIYDEVEMLPPSVLQRKMVSDGLKVVLHARVGLSEADFYFLFLASKVDGATLIGDPKSHSIIEATISQIRRRVERAIRKKLL